MTKKTTIQSLVLVFAMVSVSVAGPSALPDLQNELRQRIHPTSGRVKPQATSKDITGEAYHSGAKLLCSDCHVMHASHDGETFGGALPNPTGHSKLLKRATAHELCLSCHEGTAGVPDVVGPDVNGLTERSAGAFAASGVINAHGHNLGTTATDLCVQCHTGRVSITNPTAVVTCTHCHNPHGNGHARNLQWASYPEGTPPLGLFTDPAATGLDRYEAENVAYGTDGTEDLREVTNMCIDCHHVFSGSYVSPDGNGSYHKHPVNESERGANVPVSQGDARGTTDSAHWVAGTGEGFGVPRVRFCAQPATTYAQATNVAAGNRVFCLTCHKAHGSDYNDSVAWAPNSGEAVGPNGCDQCHNKSIPQ